MCVLLCSTSSIYPSLFAIAYCLLPLFILVAIHHPNPHVITPSKMVTPNVTTFHFHPVQFSPLPFPPLLTKITTLKYVHVHFFTTSFIFHLYEIFSPLRNMMVTQVFTFTKHDGEKIEHLRRPSR